MPSHNKPLPEPVLKKILDAMEKASLVYYELMKKVQEAGI